MAGDGQTVASPWVLRSFRIVLRRRKYGSEKSIISVPRGFHDHEDERRDDHGN